MLAFALIYLSYFLSLFIVPYFLTLFFSIHFQSVEFGEYCFPTIEPEEEETTVGDIQDQIYEDPPSSSEEDNEGEVEGYEVDFQVFMDGYCGPQSASLDISNDVPQLNRVAANNQHPPPIMPSRIPDAPNLPQPSDGPSIRSSEHVFTPTLSVPPQAFYPYMVTPQGALMPPIILYHMYPFCNMPLDYFKKLYEQCRQQLIVLALSNDDSHTQRVKLIFGETHRPFRLARKEKESSRKVNRYYPYRRRSMNERSRLRQGIKGWPYSLERLWGFKFKSKSNRRTKDSPVLKTSDILLEQLLPENLLRKKRLESPPPPFPSILNNAYAPIPSSTPNFTFLHPPKIGITQPLAKALGKRPCRDWDHGNEENSDIGTKQTRRFTVEAELRVKSPSLHKSKSVEFVFTKPPTVLPDKRRYSQRRSPSPPLGRQAGSRKKRRLTESQFLEISDLSNEENKKENEEKEKEQTAPCTPPRNSDSTPELSDTPGGEEEMEVLVTPPQPSSTVVGEEIQVVSPISEGDVLSLTSPTQLEIESTPVQAPRRRKNRPAPLVFGGYLNPAGDTPAASPTRAEPRAVTLPQQPQMVGRDTLSHFMAPSLDGYTHSPTTAMFLDGPANMAGGEVESESGDEPGQGKRKWKPNKLRRLMTHLPYLQPTSPSPATNFLHNRRQALVQHIQKLLAEKPVVPEAVSVVPPPLKQPDREDPPLPISPLASDTPNATRALNPYDLKPWPRELPKQDPASVNYTYEFLRTLPELTRFKWAKEANYARVLRETFHYRFLMHKWEKEEREAKEEYGEIGDFMRALQNTSNGDALGMDQSSGGRKQLRRTPSSTSIFGENAQAGPSKRLGSRSGPSTPTMALGSPFQGDIGSIIASEYALACPSIVSASVTETVSSSLRDEDSLPAGTPLPSSHRPIAHLTSVPTAIPSPAPPNDLILSTTTASSVEMPSEPVQESRDLELSTHTRSSTPSPHDNASIEPQETIFISPSSESTVEAKDVSLKIAEKESIAPEGSIPASENSSEEVEEDENVEKDTHNDGLAILSSREEQGDESRSEEIGLTCAAPSIVELQNDTQTSIASSEVEPKDKDETSTSSISKSASSPSSANTSIIASRALETSSTDPKIAQESVLRAAVTEESPQMKFTFSFPTTSNQTAPIPSVAPAPPSPKPQAAVVEASETGSNAPFPNALKSTFDFLTRPVPPTPLGPISTISRAIDRATSSSRLARGKARSHGGAIRGELGGLWAAHAARTANKVNPPKFTKKTDGGKMERQLKTALKEGETEMQDQDISEVVEERQEESMEIVPSDIQGSFRPTSAFFPLLASSFSTVHDQRVLPSQHQSNEIIRRQPRSPQPLSIFERRRNASAPSEVEDEMEVDEICETPPNYASSTPPAYTHRHVLSPTSFNRFYPIAPQSAHHQASHQSPSSISSSTNEEVEMTNEDFLSNTAAHNQRGSSFAQQMYMPNIVSSYLAQLAHRPPPAPARFMEDTEMQEAILMDTPTQPSFPSHPVTSNFTHNVAAPQPHLIPPTQATRVEPLPPHLQFRQPAFYDADQADEDEFEEVEIPDPPSSAAITNKMVRETESVRQGISSLSISDPETVLLPNLPSVDIVPEPSRAAIVDPEVKITPPPSDASTSSRLPPSQVHIEQPVIVDAAFNWADPPASPRSSTAEMNGAEDPVPTSGTPAESNSTPQPILSTTLGNVIPTPISATVTSPSEDPNMPFSQPSILSTQGPFEADLTFQNALEPRNIKPLRASGYAASAKMGLRMLASIAEEKEEIDHDMIDMKAVEDVINGDEKVEESGRRSSWEEKGKNKAVEVEGVPEGTYKVEESTETLSYGDRELIDMLTSGPLPSWLAPESEPTVYQEPSTTFFDQQWYNPTQGQYFIPSCLNSSFSTAPPLFDYNGYPLRRRPVRSQEQFAIPPTSAIAPPSSPPSTPPPPAVEVATKGESDFIPNAKSGKERVMAYINNTSALGKISSRSSSGHSLFSMSPVLTRTQMGKIDEEIDLRNFKNEEYDKANMPPPGFVTFPKQRFNQGSSGTSAGNLALPPAIPSSSGSAFKPVIGPSKSTLITFPSSSLRSSEAVQDSGSWELKTSFQAAKRGNEKAQEEELQGRADIPIFLPVLTPDLIFEDTQGPLTRILARLPARVRRALDAAATDAQQAPTNANEVGQLGYPPSSTSSYESYGTWTGQRTSSISGDLGDFSVRPVDIPLRGS
ncbi:uncharacterized protein L199_002533 [Kwoniella botswanensis]|uniref:uncharacterized protein n=1 Tax=Kwoniella botswanensis TaxID=1268659 RepID=UPI00315CE1BD